MSAPSDVLHPRGESARINLRTSPEAKALIERAAALMGTTVSSFLLQNAYETAIARLWTMRNSVQACGVSGRLTTSMTCASGGGWAEISC